MPSGYPQVQPIEHGNFTGINNTDDPTLIGMRALQTCKDYDNTQDGRLVARPGQTQISGTAAHSIWSNKDKTLCLYRSGSDLVRLNADETSTVLASGFSGNRMVFRDGAAGEVFLTDGVSIGMVTGNAVYQDISGIAPYDHFKDSPMAGVSIEFGKGRLYVIIGNKAFFSDPFMPFQFDIRNNVISFGGPITLFRVTNYGIWVADGKIKFLTGGDPTSAMPVTIKAEYNAIPGTDTMVPSTIIGQQPIGGTKMFILSTRGACLCGEDGGFENLTERKYAATFGSVGAGLFRRDLNINRYIAVTKG